MHFSEVFIVKIASAQFKLFIGNDLLYFTAVLFCVTWQYQKYITVCAEIIIWHSTSFNDDVFFPICSAAVVWCVVVAVAVAVALERK